jgi:hypothetical protein
MTWRAFSLKPGVILASPVGQPPSARQAANNCGAVDGAVDAAAAGKLRIGRVDDRIDIERRDVGDDDFETGRRDF